MSPQTPDETLAADFAALTSPVHVEAVPGRLQPAAAPNGEPFDHDCIYRRMLRELALIIDVPELPNGNFEGTALYSRLIEVTNTWRAQTGRPLLSDLEEL